MGNMLNSLFGRDWAERSRFYGDLLNCMKISSCRGGSNGQVLHRAFRVSAQVPVLQQVPRILAARRQLCLLSSSTVTAVPSRSSKLAAHPAGAGPAHLRTPPAWRGESHLLLTTHFKGFEAQTLSQPLSSHTGKTGMQKSVNGEKHCFKNNSKNC